MWKITILTIALLIFATNPKTSIQSNTTSSTPNPQAPKVEVIAKNLEVPWALAFLPDGKILITERTGRIKILEIGKGDPREIAKIKVTQISESGLHGIAVHPKYPQKPYLYLYYTYSDNGNNTLNRVSRFKFENEALSDEKVIIDSIPGALIHDGGRIKFGPDEALYITTGDAANPSLSQDKNSLAGKILRVKDDKGAEIYSLGHRNPQGIAWDDQKRLWATEHGQSATDELNLIEMGNNYGWPIIRGDGKKEGLISPKIQSGSTTWAPAGMAYINNSLFFAGLRGQTLYEAVLDGDSIKLKEHFKGEFGRIREVVLGLDNMLYVTTSNRDGRGLPISEDDRIIRINPN